MMKSLMPKVVVTLVVVLLAAVALSITALNAVHGERRARAELAKTQNENVGLKESKFLIEETLKRAIDQKNEIDDRWRKAGEPITYAGQYREATPENLWWFLRLCDSKPRAVGCSRHKKGEKVPIYVGVLDLRPD